MTIDVAAAVAANDKLLGLSGLPLNTRRRTVAMLLAWQEAHGLEPDGIYDRATEESLNTALLEIDEPDTIAGEPDDVAIVHSAGAPFLPWPGPTPMTSAQWYAKAGTPGPKGSAWDLASIVDARGLDERKTKKGEPGYTGVHCLALPYANEAIARVRLTGYRLVSVGGYVYRRIRHQKTGPLSKHASGLALDLNSNANFGKTFGVNEDGPEPFSKEWNRIWDSPLAITPEAVQAMESCGWKWGGRWRAPKGKRGFRDPMHWQR